MNQKSCVSYLNIIMLVGLVLVCSILVIALMSGSNIFPTAPKMPLREQLSGGGSLWLIFLSVVIILGFVLVYAINFFIPPKDSSWSFLTIAGILVLPFALLCFAVLVILRIIT